VTAPAPLDDEETAGLAGERTDMAWNRTGLALGVAVASVLRLLLDDLDDLTARAWVFVLIGAGAMSIAVSMFHARSIAGATMSGERVADPRRLRALSDGTALFAVASLVLALLSG
jgi:uncharacterized membrane protein YidH (DUF202 family)